MINIFSKVKNQYTFGKLFGDDDSPRIHFIPVKNKRSSDKIENALRATATRYGYKISAKHGFWIDIEKKDATPVLRVELTDRPKREIFKERRKNIRIKANIICNMRKNGATYQQIADRFGVSRQCIYNFVKYHRLGE